MRCALTVTWFVLAVGSLAQEDTGHVLEMNPAVMAPLAVKSLLLDAVSVEDTVYAVGVRGHILKSEDAGQTWVQQQVPVRTFFTGVHFHDPNLGWAVGHDMVIVKTEDGGATWKVMFSAPEEERPFLDVWFHDAQYGLAVGAYGLLMRTQDGGVTWEMGSVSTGEDDEEIYDYHLNGLISAGGNRLYIAAEAGHVYRSDDLGKTWTTLSSPYEGSYFGILPVSMDEFLIFGLRGHMFRSVDGGETYSEIQTKTQALLNSAIRLDDGSIIVVGLEGMVLVSHDGGQSFEPHRQEGRKGYSKVVQTSSGAVVLVGEGGVKRLDPGNYSEASGGS